MFRNVASQIRHEVWSLEFRLLHIKWAVVNVTTPYMKIWFIFWHRTIVTSKNLWHIESCDLLTTFHVFTLKTSKSIHVVNGNHLPPMHQHNNVVCQAIW